MAKICILSALLLQLLYTSIQGQNSPCPDRFTYIKKPGSDETIGEIEIQNPSINNLELSLKVDLKVDTQLPTSFIGGVNLTKSQEDAARDVLESKPLLYHVYFPIQNPLPTVHRIRFNNYQICSGPEVSGSVVTIIALEHNVKIIIRPAQNQPNPPLQNTPAEQKPNNSSNPFVSPFTSGTTEQAPVDMFENYNECGIGRGSKSPNFRIGRRKTSPGEWPWVAAIFRFITYYEYICGGTLLTTRHVITAEYCLRPDLYTGIIPANKLSVVLGRYQLKNYNESESVTMDVARFIFLSSESSRNSDPDPELAILILRSPVEFTAFIRPICLLPRSVDSRRFNQTHGFIVGWDKYGENNEEPMLTTMSIVTTDECDPTFTSDCTFYASTINHSGPSYVDIGSGLVIYDSATGRYQLRGIKSRQIYRQPLVSYGLITDYVVFVDVFKYLTWINQQIYSTLT